MTQNNPLQGFYRTAKVYTRLPSQGKFYDADVIDMPENGELPVFPMTAKDEMIMKNPDALLNGEAVAQVITSCVPAVKKPRRLIGNDIDTLLVAIQGASSGDDIDISGKCPDCGEEITSVASIQGALDSMSILDEAYSFDTEDGLHIVIRPFTYDSVVKAGIANFHSTRSLQAIQGIEDEMDQLKAFNENFMKIAALNFELLVDSIASISGKTPEGEEFVVTDNKQIQEFMENCDRRVGKRISEEVQSMGEIGINKTAQLECEKHGVFETQIGFDPVNFFTAS